MSASFVPVRASLRAVVALVLAGQVVAFNGHSSVFPADFFGEPLEIPMVLAGNFAELRSNHFHAGLDLKTDKQEGLRVLAAGGGWITRIKVSPVGYGNALYVTHPNGYSTVYAHLKSFSEPFATFVRDLQYRNKRFDVDVYLKKNEFPVEKGQVIGLSGNSGSSYAPHLHFEIRDARTNTPVNPLLFAYDIQDSIPPKIFRIKVYPKTPSSYAEVVYTHQEGTGLATYHEPLVIEARPGASPADFELLNVKEIRVFGTVSFGLQTNDYHDASSNRLGAYRVRLDSNGEMLFEFEMERIGFRSTRYINAHVDYAEHRANRRWIQRSYKLPGNRLDIYRHSNDGYLDTRRDSTYRMLYTVVDARGNSSTLPFVVTGTAQNIFVTPVPSEAAASVPHTEEFAFARDGIRAYFPANTFYEDQPIRYERLPAIVGALSDLHRLHDPTAPLHRRMTLSIDAPDLPAALMSKVVVARVDEEFENISSAGGGYKDGKVVARPRSFGIYFVAADTVAPSITPIGLTPDGAFASDEVVSFTVKDDLSGLRRYEGTIDGEWALFDYDAKKNRITHRIDADLPIGRHEVAVLAEDNKGNKRQITVPLVR